MLEKWFSVRIAPAVIIDDVATVKVFVMVKGKELARVHKDSYSVALERKSYN